MEDWLLLTPRDLAALINKITTKAGSTPANIGLTTELVEQLEAKSSGLTTKQEVVETTRDAYKAAQKALETEVKESKVLMRRARQKIEASDASPQDKSEAGMPDSDETTSPLMAPTDLVVIAEGTVNKLKWKKNGNSAGVQYVIEGKIGSADWTLLDVITSTKYAHSGRTLGERAMYRIKARKSNQLSAPSNEAGVNLS